VAEDHEPPTLDPAHGRELRPPTPQERAVTVPPDPDVPGSGPAAGRANDKGLVIADLRCHFVGDALQIKGRLQDRSVRRSTAGATRGGRRASARTRVLVVKHSSTRGCLAAAASDSIGRSGDAGYSLQSVGKTMGWLGHF
jgi:hypothetical protein